MSASEERPSISRLVESRWFPVAASAGLVLVFAGAYRDWYIDDTYIYLQFARNLITRGEFAFNAGEVVPAVTGPLWVFLIAALGKLGVPLLVAAKCLSAAAGIGAVWCCYLLARDVLGRASWAWAATSLFAFDGWWSRTPYSGMESAAGVFAALAVLVLRRREAERAYAGISWSVFVAALGVLVRPELALLLVLTLADRALTERRLGGVMREAGLAAAVLAPYVAWATLTFGTPLPTTFAAKRDPGVAWLPAVGGTLWRLARIVGVSQGAQAVLLAAGVAAARRTFVRSRDRLALAWLVALPGFYVVRGVGSLLSSRYLIMVTPILAVYALRGLQLLGERVVAPAGRRAVLGVAATALAVQAVWFHAGVVYPSSVKSMADFDAGWRATALWVRDNTPKDAKVAAGAMGILGYFSERHIVDIGGLVDPGAFGGATVDGVPAAEYLRAAGTDYLVTSATPGEPPPPALRLLNATTITSGIGLAGAEPVEMRVYRIEWAGVGDAGGS